MRALLASSVPRHTSGMRRSLAIKRIAFKMIRCSRKEEALEQLGAPDEGTLKSKRDRAMLFVLVGCGLRRSELTHVETQDLKQLEGRWVFADIQGKG